MKLKHITFLVPDIEESITFYTKLVGLSVQFTISSPIGEIVFLANQKGETMIELIQFKNGSVFTGEGMVIAFAYEGSLSTLHQKAMELGYQPDPIHGKGPMPTNFRITVPAGIVVEFCN
ncbi:lactoylglutathione lyase [Breznakia blatticola]|uniref:Lactoylglutathione lyase n=1 Tax=Breznakia blatticola TaxID=1754012 RepID=A0A4R8A3Z5_9FIRM|nr:VOC family protein [Breznakia blatticola]TDW25327.1 lactoylglutathione lyase [Breznakia blatticola]